MWDSDFESALKSLEMRGQSGEEGELQLLWAAITGAWWAPGGCRCHWEATDQQRTVGVPVGTKRNLRCICINVAKWTTHPHPSQHYWGAPRPKAVSPSCQSTPSPRLPFKASLSRMPLSAFTGFIWIKLYREEIDLLCQGLLQKEKRSSTTTQLFTTHLLRTYYVLGGAAAAVLSGDTLGFRHSDFHLLLHILPSFGETWFPCFHPFYSWDWSKRQARLLGTPPKQADNLLGMATEPLLRRGPGPCMLQEFLYVGVIWPLRVSQGNGLIS